MPTEPGLIIPPRSRLFHLAPIGVGTPEVESLTGYLKRLADAHCVPVYQLARHEIVPLLPGDWASKDHARLSTLLGRQAGTLNGPGAAAGVWVRSLERLTLRSDLRPLTLQAWGSLLPSHGLLRHTLAWCPACYAEWHALERPVYQSLMWALAVVEGCPRHRRRLRECCPRTDCARPQPLLTSPFPPGYCAHCGGWLGDDAGPDVAATDGAEREESAAKATNDEPETWDEGAPGWQEWVVSVTGTLLASATRTTPARREDVLATLVGLIEPFRGSLAALTREAGLGPGVLANRLAGECLPTLPGLLRLCRCLGITPLQVLVAEERLSPVSTPKSPTSPVPARQCQPRRAGGRFDVDAARPHMIAAVRESETSPVSLSSLARRLGVGRSTLEGHFPAECATIVARYLAEQGRRRGEDRVRVARKVRRVVRAIHQQGQYPSGRKVLTLMGDPHAFRNSHGLAVWRDALRELGWEPGTGGGRADG